MKKLRVLVVDDSAQARRLLTRILEQDPVIEVCGTACDPYDARSKIKVLEPDVLTLDIEMPKMDGITFLRNLMRLHPMPVVMISCMTEKNPGVDRQSLLLGAHAFIKKPVNNLEKTLENYSKEIISKVKAAAIAHNKTAQPNNATDSSPVKRNTADAVIKKLDAPVFSESADSLIAIGASTGGTEAIKEILDKLPQNSPAVVITQHISIPFSTYFAKRMDSSSALTVCEAKDGQNILPGHAYIAPGNMHLLVVHNSEGYRCKLVDGPPVNHHTPSVDVLFRSVAQCAGPAAVSVLLTGMGKDGALGMKEMRDAGASTIVQDEASSVVWGMPGTAVKLGVAENVLPIEKIAEKILALCQADNNPLKKLYRRTS